MGVEDEAMEPSPYHLVAEWFDKWTESDGVKFKHLGDFGADFFIEKEGDTFYLTSHGPGIELIIKSSMTAKEMFLFLY